MCLQLVERDGRVAGFEHALKHLIDVGFGAAFARSQFIVDPGIDNDLVFAREPIKESKTLVKLGAEPVPVVLSQGCPNERVKDHLTKIFGFFYCGLTG